MKVTQEVDRLTELDTDITRALEEKRKVDLQASQIIAVEQARNYWSNFFKALNWSIPPEIWIAQLTPFINGQPASIAGGPAAGSGAKARGRGGRLRAPVEEMTPPGMPG